MILGVSVTVMVTSLVGQNHTKCGPTDIHSGRATKKKQLHLAIHRSFFLCLTQIHVNLCTFEIFFRIKPHFLSRAYDLITRYVGCSVPQFLHLPVLSIPLSICPAGQPSICSSVRPSFHPSPSVFSAFRSGFCITTPAQ